MSHQKPKTITLRRVEVGETLPGDYWVETLAETRQDHHTGNWYREVNTIPEGYEPCDLADATKVLIGETWCDVERDAGGSWIMVLPNKTYHMHGFSNLGLLAIRLIPEPEPMRGEARAGQLIVSGRPDSAVLYLPEHLIGKVIRWEEVVKDWWRMNLREHVMEAVSAVEVTVPAGELLELLDERDALKDRVSSLEFRLGFRASDSPMPATIEARADGSIEGGWDIQDGDEMVTVEVPPPVGDCSCKVPELSPRLQAYAEAIAPSTFERAVCGSRQPPSQEAEMAAPLPVLKDKPFVSDKGAGKPSEAVVPWKALYNPNQCRLVLQCLDEGMHRVTAAAKANVTRETVNDIAKQYKTQLDRMDEMGPVEAEKFLDSLYRQMLARWKAAGKDPAVQPELPVPTKTLSEAAKPDKPSKGKAGNL